MRFGKRLEVFGKRLASSLLARLLVGSSKEEHPPPIEHIRSLLFVRPNFRMGNTLMVTPAIRAARQAMPDAQLGILTSSSYGHMLRDTFELNETHMLTRGMAWKWWEWIRLIRDIRSSKYDVVVDCSEGESLLGAAFAVFSGAPYRLGPKGSKQEAVFNLRPTIYEESEHRIERLLALLRYVGMDADDASMFLHLNASHVRWAASRWEQLGLDSEIPVIGINVGARGDKRWPLSSFTSLIADLMSRGFRILLFVGPQELDRLASMEEGLSDEVLIDTTDDPSRFAALIKNCAAFVTADTGPMHLAVAVDTPTVAIFVRPNFGAYGPLGSNHSMVFDPRKRGVKRVLASVLERVEPARPSPVLEHRHSSVG